MTSIYEKEVVMLETYFNTVDSRVTNEQHKRIIAMQAALEFAKASATASTGLTRGDKVECDLQNAAKEIAGLAKAIQSYLDEGK